MNIRGFATLLLFSVVLVGTTTAQQFTDSRSYQQKVPTGPVVTGDFNRDGLPDFVYGVSCCGGQTLSVELGRGDGTFVEGQQLGGIGVIAQAMVSGDWNHDGITDLATASSYQSVIAIFLGNGDGTFNFVQQYTISGSEPDGIGTGDVNGDGIADLVTANCAKSVTVLLGLGGGAFGPPATYTLPLPEQSVVVGDLNADGRDDVVATTVQYDGPPTLFVLLSNSDGTLRSPVAYDAGKVSYATIADMNRDGIPDLVASGSDVSVLLGNGDGSFQTAQVYVGNETDCLSGGVTAVDVNHDGFLDVVSLQRNICQAVQVYPGRGDGTLATVPLLYGTSSRSGGFGLADFNKDGYLDFVTTSDIARAYGVVLGTSGGKFLSRRDFMPGGEVAAGFLDADNNLDVVVTGSFSFFNNRMSMLRGKGDGTFGAATSLVAGNLPSWVTIADVNADGKNDIVTANAFDDTISILLGNGNGSFQTHMDYATGPGTSFVTTGDLNGDGKPDVITSNGSLGVGDTTFSVLLNDGTGKFPAHVDYDLQDRPEGIGVGDFNRDGKLDIVVLGFNGGKANIFLGNGDGTLSPGAILQTGAEPESVAVGDVNGDGKLDVVVARSLPAGTTLFLGRGDGSFGPPTFLPGAQYGKLALLADFNGDGKLDIVTSGFDASNEALLMLGNGDGTFQQPQLYPTSSIAVAPSRSAVAADFNHDGAIDLLTSGNSAFSLLLNTGVN